MPYSGGSVHVRVSYRDGLRVSYRHGMRVLE